MYRGIIGFKKCNQPRYNIVKDEKRDLFTDFPIILARWRNYFPQLFNVHVVSDIRQTDIHTAEPLVTERSALEVDMDINKIKSHNCLNQTVEQFDMRSTNLLTLILRRSRTGTVWF